MKHFDIEFYTGTKPQLIDEIAEARNAPFSYVVTPNVNHIVQLEHNGALKGAYESAAWRICDSRILDKLLRRMNAHIDEVIPGSTLTADLVEMADRERWTISVIGAASDDIRILKQRYSGITIRHHNPPMGFIDNPAMVEECLDFVIHNPAQLVILAVGCPRQEILARKLWETGQATGVGLCVGASINFLSGKVKRAPQWMQRMSLEWLHRMCTEPRRLTKRYLLDAINVLPIVVREFR